jgi:hypothetical protein
MRPPAWNVEPLRPLVRPLTLRPRNRLVVAGQLVGIGLLGVALLILVAAIHEGWTPQDGFSLFNKAPAAPPAAPKALQAPKREPLESSDVIPPGGLVLRLTADQGPKFFDHRVGQLDLTVEFCNQSQDQSVILRAARPLDRVGFVLVNAEGHVIEDGAYDERPAPKRQVEDGRYVLPPGRSETFRFRFEDAFRNWRRLRPGKYTLHAYWPGTNGPAATSNEVVIFP